jgi:hypothetical protein
MALFAPCASNWRPAERRVMMIESGARKRRRNRCIDIVNAMIAAPDMTLLDPGLAIDIEAAIANALAAGVVFESGDSSVSVFRAD